MYECVVTLEDRLIPIRSLSYQRFKHLHCHLYLLKTSKMAYGRLSALAADYDLSFRFCFFVRYTRAISFFRKIKDYSFSGFCFESSDFSTRVDESSSRNDMIVFSVTAIVSRSSCVSSTFPERISLIRL